jgi:hypothetical protein
MRQHIGLQWGNRYIHDDPNIVKPRLLPDDHQHDNALQHALREKQ